MGMSRRGESLHIVVHRPPDRRQSCSMCSSPQRASHTSSRPSSIDGRHPRRTTMALRLVPLPAALFPRLPSRPSPPCDNDAHLSRPRRPLVPRPRTVPSIPLSLRPPSYLHGVSRLSQRMGQTPRRPASFDVPSSLTCATPALIHCLSPSRSIPQVIPSCINISILETRHS